MQYGVDGRAERDAPSDQRRLIYTKKAPERMQNYGGGDIGERKRKPASTEEILRAALAERDQFLEKRPHMQAYQDEIDTLLDKSGNHQGRLMVLGTLMQGKLLEIQRQLFQLNKLIQTSMS